MMTVSIEFIVYLVAGVSIMVLYYIRKKGFDLLKPEVLPELDKSAFLDLKSVLASAYDRTLYLGVSFLFLAYTEATSSEIKLFAIILTVSLFIANIFPRHKAMKILTAAGVDISTLKERGVRF